MSYRNQRNAQIAQFVHTNLDKTNEEEKEIKMPTQSTFISHSDSFQALDKALVYTELKNETIFTNIIVIKRLRNIA